MRLIGIDYGRARIGVALGDTETHIASPLLILDNTGDENALRELVRLAKEETVDAFVIGIPKPLRDRTRETDQAREIRAYARRLSEATGLPVHEADETLSSALAERQAAEMGEYKKRDDLAAAAILQGYLDRGAS